MERAEIGHRQMEPERRPACTCRRLSRAGCSAGWPLFESQLGLSPCEQDYFHLSGSPSSQLRQRQRQKQQKLPALLYSARDSPSLRNSICPALMLPLGPAKPAAWEQLSGWAADWTRQLLALAVSQAQWTGWEPSGVEWAGSGAKRAPDSRPPEGQPES